MTRALLIMVASVIVVTVATIAGCVRTSGGTWYFESAGVPEGWPELTPVGEVQVKQYPSYRAAKVTDDEAGVDERSMFMTLFEHISANDIAMTAPVDMAYRDDDPAELDSMAFLYASDRIGQPGRDGAVEVSDIRPRRYASVGVRGAYSQEHFREGVATLEAWLLEHPDWAVTGPPRFLGYNGPFVPGFWKYGEVQVPVTGGEDTPAE